ncbi:methyl-accepting chemotaxis sensory transducer with Cache sensor [Desulfuromusa kysingii]|uniref:Methyl-accepting chemotaxis sensory transducer with Cache sensor n=1 Tax=Desulfuromusa kysingii TaxID=37625 RepID=A0A1H3W9V9_9BACT|nr:methyl-accepting chemotaxis protein [Desulfuromusa kysingii]SDZ83876.1 methyl-accepting chemotaxis sensory transducer with Cache sensor [Desulfuromusa kysingii]
MGFENLKISTKIYLVIALIILVFTCGISWIYTGYRDQIHKTAELKLKAAVETAVGIIDHNSQMADEGLITTEEAQNNAIETIKKLRIEQGKLYFWINDTHPKMIMHPINPALDGSDLSQSIDPTGKQLFMEMVKITAKDGAGFVNYMWEKPGKDKPQPKMSFVQRTKSWNWIVGCGVYIDDLGSKVNAIFYSILAIVSLVILASVAMAYVLARSLSHPIKQTVDMIDEIEKGHYQIRLNLQRKDEIGHLGAAMDNLNDNFETVLLPTLNRLADGDITFNPVPRDDNDGTRIALKKVSDNLNETMQQIQRAGEQITSASEQIADSSQTLSEGATESAASLEEISSSLNQMASQTKLNADNASQVNLLSSEAKQATEEGKSKMEQMVAAMTDISDAGKSINKIIKVIDEIAFQTNLLALNAAVEAARAGQHGKGFAVVAEEVRNLAARSAKAASETAELIEGSVKKTENGALIANQTAESLESVYGGVLKVSVLAEEIAAASNEQADGIGQINEGLGQIDQAIQQNTATAEESAAAAEELSSQAEELLSMLKRFQLRGQVQQQAIKRTVTAPAPQNRLSAGWGQAAHNSPRQTIALDDDEFGKF